MDILEIKQSILLKLKSTIKQVENTEVKGSVKLLKVDNEDISKKLEGAVFELKDESGK